jgi:Zn-dependent protease with chaperone function
MTSFLETLELALLAAVLFTVAGAALAALAYPRLRARLALLRPAARTDLLLCMAAAPVLAGLLLTAVCFLPGEFGSGGFEDHCTEHPGHVHLCLVHHPPLDQGVVGWTVVAAVALVLAGTAAWQGRRLLRSARALSALQRAPRVSTGSRDVRVLHADIPLSAAAGLVRPAVYLSSGLLRAVDADVLEVVKAHERAHVRRRDPLRQVLATLFSLALFPSIRRALLADLALATEQACDEEAVLAVGDRTRVARAVLAVERVIATASVPRDLVVASFGGSNVPDRVAVLLADSSWHRARHVPAWVAAFLVALLFATSPLHHATETLLSWLTR